MEGANSDVNGNSFESRSLPANLKKHLLILADYENSLTHATAN